MGLWLNSEGSYCHKLLCRLSGIAPTLLFCLLLTVGICELSKEEATAADPPEQQIVKMPLPQRGTKTGTPETPDKTSADSDKTPEVAQTPKSGQNSAFDEYPKSTKPLPPAKDAIAKQPLPTPDVSVRGAESSENVVKMPLPPRKGARGKKTTVAPAPEPKNATQIKKDQRVEPVKKDNRVLVTAPDAAKTTVVDKRQNSTPARAATPRTSSSDNAKAPGESWTVSAGPYTLEETMSNDLSKIGKAGISAMVQQGPSKNITMHRLFLGQYGDKDTAGEKLEELKNFTSDAFILKRGDKYSVYAGSYVLDERAKSEKKRLAAIGFELTATKTDVTLATKNLIVGSYDERNNAEAVAKQLKNAGLKNVQVR